MAIRSCRWRSIGLSAFATVALMCGSCPQGLAQANRPPAPPPPPPRPTYTPPPVQQQSHHQQTNHNRGVIDAQVRRIQDQVRQQQQHRLDQNHRSTTQADHNRRQIDSQVRRGQDQMRHEQTRDHLARSRDIEAAKSAKPGRADDAQRQQPEPPPRPAPPPNPVRFDPAPAPPAMDADQWCAMKFDFARNLAAHGKDEKAWNYCTEIIQKHPNCRIAEDVRQFRDELFRDL